ncbi:MAG: disulfide bond formation protein DsbA [Novosphingobium sp.]|nr:disulfide bond formation protein DsbA [Novosphingobium sp.]
MAETPPRRIGAFIMVATLFAVAGAGAGWWYESQRSASADGPDAQLEASLAIAGIDGKERAAIEGLVRTYILEHPEVLPQAMERLQQREAAAQIAPMRGALETPFPGAVLGNPNGKVTLVEFTDFACTYCRQSVKALEGLIARNPDLRVVIRELPIIAPESAPAARMALAAAAQGRYAAYHKGMFEGARPSEQSIAQAAQSAGMDLAAARTFAARSDVEAELKRNLEMARQLGVNGTPAWIIGDRMIHGAVPAQDLQAAIDAARAG